MFKALAFASCALVAQSPGSHPFTVHDLLAMDRIQEFRVSPDRSQVAYTVSVTDLEANKRRSSLWLAKVDGSGARRLTTHPASDWAPHWSPDGTLYFLSARSGSAQVWKIDPTGGEVSQVTRLPLDVDALEVAPTGAFLTVAMPVFPGQSPEATAAKLEAPAKRKTSGMVFDSLFVRHWDTWKDGTRNHLFRVDPATGEAKDLMPALQGDAPSKPFGGSEEYALSPDGRRLVFTARVEGKKEAWSTNHDLWEVPTDGSAAPVRLTTNPAWDTQPAFSPDGKTLAYVAMTRPGYEADRFDLMLRDLATGKERRIVVRVEPGPRGDRSVGELAWTPDGREVLCTGDHLGQKAIFAVDVEKGGTRIVHAAGAALNPQVVAGGRVLFGLNSLTQPTELVTVGLDGKDLRPLTHLNDARVAQVRFGQTEQFTFKGAKGDTVHAYLVKPVDFDPAKTYPLAYLIHGGPQGSFGNDFHYRWNPQAYAGAGYAAIMVDFHGSTGYGQAFTDAINGDWGGAPFEDLMKGLEAATAKYPFLDGKRVGALGASYGGFMINWLAGNAPDRFKALVCHDGNLDERMAYFDTEELWFPEWEHGGTPWENPKGYAKHNPVDHVAKWKTPMLVIHGGKDYRVVDTQGLSTFTVLQRRGIPSRLLYFPEENHWVLRPGNTILWHDTVLGWLDQWVK